MSFTENKENKHKQVVFKNKKNNKEEQTIIKTFVSKPWYKQKVWILTALNVDLTTKLCLEAKKKIPSTCRTDLIL